MTGTLSILHALLRMAHGGLTALPVKDTGAVAGKIRTVKSREAQLKQEGMTGSQAGHQ